MHLCFETCYECGGAPCGLTDCNRTFDAPLADWRDAYHVCPKCVARAIEKRHPKDWDYAFIIGRSKEYNAEALRTARVWQFLRDPNFLKTTKYLREGPSSNSWNNFQRNYNQSPTQPSESARTLSLLYHSTSQMPPGLATETVDRSESGEAPLVRYLRQDVHWRVDEVQPHARSTWAALVTGQNSKSVPRGSTPWLDGKLGSMRKSFDLSRRRLHDGSSAVALFRATCKKVNYTPEHYKSEPPPPPAPRYKCKFCGQDPPDHYGGDCPYNPENKGVVVERKSWQRHVAIRVQEFVSFVPWQVTLLGIVALLLGLLLETDVAQSDTVQLLTYT